MQKIITAAKNLLLDTFFPLFCMHCGKEGNCLCEDCFSLIDLLERQYCPFCKSPKIVLDGRTCSSCRRTHALAGLYCATDYGQPIVRALLHQYKYDPYLKMLAQTLDSFIIAHLIQLNKMSSFKNFVLVPVPLHKKKLRLRGFNQAQELARILSPILGVPLLQDALCKIKTTPPQMELEKEKRKENIKGVFACVKPGFVRGNRILLVDDVFTTGATLEECAKVLKGAGAKEVFGMVVARG